MVDFVAFISVYMYCIPHNPQLIKVAEHSLHALDRFILLMMIVSVRWGCGIQNMALIKCMIS